MKFKYLCATLAGLIMGVSGFANAGLITETFDTPLSSEWSGDWTIQDAAANQLSALSGQALVSSNIGGNRVSTLVYVGTFSQGIVSFDIATSTEFFFDSVSFSIDGVLQDISNGFNSWAGNAANLAMSGISSNSFNFDIAAGNRTLTWRYVKDISASEGGDAVGIDNFARTVEVHEPSALAIFALGMIGLASRRFKKQS